MSPLEFWYAHVGRKLGAESPEGSVAVKLPHRTKKGIAPLRLGSVDVLYMVSEGDCRLVGRLEMPDQPGLKVVPAESVSAYRYLAEWLRDEARPPYMVGVISKVNPIASMTLTHNERLASFAEAGRGFGFDMAKVRAAYAALAGIPWKPAAVAMHDYQRYRVEPTEASKSKLFKAFEKFPGLREMLMSVDIRPGSGEYQVLSWLNRELKEKAE